MLVEPVRFPDSITLERTSTFVLRAGTRQLDLTTVIHADQSRLFTLAIYQLEADVLIYCVAPPGQPRPSELAFSRRLLPLRRRAGLQPDAGGYLSLAEYPQGLRLP